VTYIPECEQLFNDPKHYCEACREYVALLNEVEKLRADAERYRWLTSDDHDTACRDALFTITARLPFAGKGHVDAAIDAAIRARG